MWVQDLQGVLGATASAVSAYFYIKIQKGGGVMPMKSKVANKPLPANKQKGKKICSCCHEEKNLTDFYLSYSPMYSLDKRTPVCKECCKKSCLNENGTINMDKLKELLMRCDKPLYYDLLSSAESSIKKENSYISDEEVKMHGYDVLSKYFTLIAMRQDRAKSFSDSQKENFMHTNNNRSLEQKKQIIEKHTDIELSEEKEKVIKKLVNADFVVTDEIVELFGDGYTPSVYKKMHDKYEKLKLNYSIQTNLHQEALATYVRFKVQEELATAKGDVAEAQKWYGAAQDAADKAKLTPKQLTQSDLQGGINSFSEIFKAVEQAVDVIPILPKFRYRPNDALDFNIWCYINYARDLQGLPQCSYEDVYKFYDKKKAEYIEQYGDPYGIFDDEPTGKNRPNVEKFITLPKDYEDGDE